MRQARPQSSTLTNACSHYALSIHRKEVWLRQWQLLHTFLSTSAANHACVGVVLVGDSGCEIARAGLDSRDTDAASAVSWLGDTANTLRRDLLRSERFGLLA
jgi:hypothetical protein